MSLVRLASVIHEGRRWAARLETDRVFLTEVPGLDVAVAAGSDLRDASGRWIGIEEVIIDAPLRPPVVVCAGQNYRDHLDEKRPVEVSEPELFLKAGQTVAMPGTPCVRDLLVTSKLDYETELGLVIGRAGRHIPAETALEHVYGYLVLNDLTARDRQVKIDREGRVSMALGPGKNFEGATRMAANVVSAEEVPDPSGLILKTTVNGETRQLNSTSNMIFPVAEIISYVSRLFMLRAGAVISTGSPGGTAWGTDTALGGTHLTPAGCVPARYLGHGDVVCSSIERIGELTFTVLNFEPTEEQRHAG